MSGHTTFKKNLKRDLETVERSCPGAKYNAAVEEFRAWEYPQLSGVTYLDHAATTLYSSTLIDTISSDLKSRLFGNPHSLCPSSLATTRRIEDTRVRVLQLFNADPEHFDVVFCANTTAAIKIVAEAFVSHAQKYEKRFEYRVHDDAHTSLVGVRPLSSDSLALGSQEMEHFVHTPDTSSGFGLMAYPAQSNMSGRRHPLSWSRSLRENRPGWYSLLDAAGLVTTSPLDLSDHESAPDFIALSFYKMFGYPDLGGLIVRKQSSSVLESRKYFGGGTVSFIINPREHASIDRPHAARRLGDPHEYLEDGTVPFHSIIALDHAISDHKRLYGSFNTISRHTQALSALLYSRLQAQKHSNGMPVVEINTDQHPANSKYQGATLAMNFRKSNGEFVGFNDVLKLASVRSIHLRTGGLCNPGGVTKWMDLSEDEMRKNFAAGKRCGDEWDLMEGKPTGAIRVSLGAMSTLDDIANFLSFVEEFYVEKAVKTMPLSSFPLETNSAKIARLSIYPIKSCAAFNIPASKPWKIKPHGLEFDREFCLIHQGTGKVMDMKMYPKMALIRPFIDPVAATLTVDSKNATAPLEISLTEDVPTHIHHITKKCNSRVCGDAIIVQAYSDERISGWFTTALGVPCTLARYPSTPSGGGRYMKAHLAGTSKTGQVPIALRNESPILVVSQRSLDSVNNVISSTGGKEADISVFRANIVIDGPAAFDEDKWFQLAFRNSCLQILGPCRRCHMICIDQETAERSPEPFVTLSKMRTINGKVYFGQHGTFIGEDGAESGDIQVGDDIGVTHVETETSDTDSGDSNTTEDTVKTAETAESLEPGADDINSGCVIV